MGRVVAVLGASLALSGLALCLLIGLAVREQYRHSEVLDLVGRAVRHQTAHLVVEARQRQLDAGTPSTVDSCLSIVSDLFPILAECDDPSGLNHPIDRSLCGAAMAPEGSSVSLGDLVRLTGEAIDSVSDGPGDPSAPTSTRCTVYSLRETGVGVDDFERHMATKWPCSVHVFDPLLMEAMLRGNVSSLEEVAAGLIRLHPIGVGPRASQPEAPFELIRGPAAAFARAPLKAVGGLAQELGHTRVQVVRLQIKGDEIGVVLDMLNDYRVQRLHVRMVRWPRHFTVC